MAKILLLTDKIQRVLIETLNKLKHKVLEIESPDLLINDLKDNDTDLVIIDQNNTKFALKSLELVKSSSLSNNIPVIMITSAANSNEIIEAMRLGAFDHLNSPSQIEELQSVIYRATTKPKQNIGSDPNQIDEDFLLGLSPVMRQIEKVMGMAAACDATVLIIGETGTGKDTVSRTIHRHSMHKAEPLTILDCTAVPEDYQSFQSLLPGRKGTVILDEIGDLNSQMQAMLVRALKEAPIRHAPDKIANVRIIATTQYDLVNMVKEKRFREDLYYRLNVLSIILPPLRERGSDILVLAEAF